MRPPAGPMSQHARPKIFVHSPLQRSLKRTIESHETEPRGRSGVRETEKDATWQASWFAPLAAGGTFGYNKTYQVLGFLLESLVRTLKQPRAIETRDRILREAARLFALKGFHDTKVDEIIKAAEVTSGAFFHHFQSKEDLGFAVIDRHMEERRRKLDRIEKRLPTSRNDDPLQRVFRRLDAVCEMVAGRRNRKGGCIIGNLSTALSDTHPAFRKRLAECFDEMALEFKPHLDAAVEAHHPTQKVDTRQLARYIVTVIEGAIMLSRTHGESDLVHGQVRMLKEYLRQAVEC
jgi:TetR/AcrR family transcriptional repressor of nem operon